MEVESDKDNKVKTESRMVQDRYPVAKKSYTYQELTHSGILTNYGPRKQPVRYILALKWTDNKKRHTVHGLWPSASRNEDNPNWDPEALAPIRAWLENNWESDLANHSNQSFWKHEYTKHGMCMPSKWTDLAGSVRQTNTFNYFKLVEDLYNSRRSVLLREDKTMADHLQIEWHYDENFRLVEGRALYR